MLPFEIFQWGTAWETKNRLWMDAGVEFRAALQRAHCDLTIDVEVDGKLIRASDEVN